jgi:hypothetical protein
MKTDRLYFIIAAMAALILGHQLSRQGCPACMLLPKASAVAPSSPHPKTMKLENTLRALAGTMILASLALAHYVSPNWLWLTMFVGANLFQSAFTGFCPAETILQKLGVKRS